MMASPVSGDCTAGPPPTSGATPSVLQERLAEELTLLPGRVSRYFFLAATLDMQATYMQDDLQAARRRCLAQLTAGNLGEKTLSEEYTQYMEAVSALERAQQQLLTDKLVVNRSASDWFLRAKAVVTAYGTEARKRQKPALSGPGSVSGLPGGDWVGGGVRGGEMYPRGWLGAHGASSQMLGAGQISGPFGRTRHINSLGGVLGRPPSAHDLGDPVTGASAEGQFLSASALDFLVQSGAGGAGLPNGSMDVFSPSHQTPLGGFFPHGVSGSSQLPSTAGPAKRRRASTSSNGGLSLVGQNFSQRDGGAITGLPYSGDDTRGGPYEYAHFTGHGSMGGTTSLTGGGSVSGRRGSSAHASSSSVASGSTSRGHYSYCARTGRGSGVAQRQGTSGKGNESHGFGSGGAAFGRARPGSGRYSATAGSTGFSGGGNLGAASGDGGGLIIKLGSQKGRPRKSTSLASGLVKHVEVDEAEYNAPAPVTEASAAATADDYLCPICQKSENEDPWMVACDRCDEWYHCSCVGFVDDADAAEKAFYCPKCRDEPAPADPESKKHELDDAAPPTGLGAGTEH